MSRSVSSDWSSSDYSETLIKTIQQQIHHSGYDACVQRIFCDMVNATVEISTELYPCSNILHESCRRRVERIAKRFARDIGDVNGHIQASIQDTDKAEGELRKWCITIGGNLSWRTLNRGKPLPDGSEAALFGNMAELFDMVVFHPLIELHKSEPNHNMYVLEETISELSVELQELVRYARIADAAIADLYRVHQIMIRPATRASSIGSMWSGRKLSPRFPSGSEGLLRSRSGSIREIAEVNRSDENVKQLRRASPLIWARISGPARESRDHGHEAAAEDKDKGKHKTQRSRSAGPGEQKLRLYHASSISLPHYPSIWY